MDSRIHSRQEETRAEHQRESAAVKLYDTQGKKKTRRSANKGSASKIENMVF